VLHSNVTLWRVWGYEGDWSCAFSWALPTVRGNAGCTDVFNHRHYVARSLIIGLLRCVSYYLLNGGRLDTFRPERQFVCVKCREVGVVLFDGLLDHLLPPRFAIIGLQAPGIVVGEWLRWLFGPGARQFADLSFVQPRLALWITRECGQLPSRG